LINGSFNQEIHFGYLENNFLFFAVSANYTFHNEKCFSIEKILRIKVNKVKDGRYWLSLPMDEYYLID